jgi:hypothetical protein
MAQSAILSHPATIRSRKVASSLLGAAAALLLLAAGGVLFDLRQEMVNQREYAQRAEKLDFRVVDFLAGQGFLVAPQTVNSWTKTLHIGWSRMEVAPDRCKEQSYMIKKPGPSVFTHMPNDWYLCARAPTEKFVLPNSLTSGYWLYPLQILLAGAIMAWIAFRLWPRRPEAGADDAKPALASTKNPAPARGAMR